jgi:aminoglycoside 2'-N-acetyltransferase I
VATFKLPAAAIGDTLAAELAHLLSLAFTDRRHLDLYSQQERAAWLAAAESLHSGRTGTMPAAWLTRFPSLQNLKRPPGERQPSTHFMERRAATLAGHVALMEQAMRVGEALVHGAYIEDVATHPALVGAGIASALLRAAVELARTSGCDVAGLGTGIPAFYERLGWRSWPGPATYVSPSGEVSFDTGTMMLPLTARGGELLAAPAGTTIHIGHRLA